MKKTFQTLTTTFCCAAGLLTSGCAVMKHEAVAKPVCAVVLGGAYVVHKIEDAFTPAPKPAKEQPPAKPAS